MDLPVMPPVKPMLAKAVSGGVDGVPGIDGDVGDVVFEPKWDGFRCIVFRDGDDVELGSRNERPLTRYFPEILPPLLAQLPDRCVVDGEIVVVRDDSLDFDALQQRLHPAESRVNRLAGETPASFIAFDLLALGDESLCDLPFIERRARLESVLAAVTPPVHLTPTTTDRAVAAEWFERFEGAGLDGLIAKDPMLPYVQDKRVQWKVKHVRSADCVVAGFRWHKDGKGVGSLLLGLFDESGSTLHHVGVAASFTAKFRAELVEILGPLREEALESHPWRDWAEVMEAWRGSGQDAASGAPASSRTGAEATEEPERPSQQRRMPGGQSRWNAQKDLSWEPVRCEKVAEVVYDQVLSGRFRRVARFLRWRDDKQPLECRYDQLEEVSPHPFDSIFT